MGVRRQKRTAAEQRVSHVGHHRRASTFSTVASSNHTTAAGSPMPGIAKNIHPTRLFEAQPGSPFDTEHTTCGRFPTLTPHRRASFCGLRPQGVRLSSACLPSCPRRSAPIGFALLADVRYLYLNNIVIQQDAVAACSSVASCGHTVSN